jgi:hypothetical protein
MTVLFKPQLLHGFGKITVRPTGDDDGAVVSNMRGALMGDTPVRSLTGRLQSGCGCQ